MRRLFAFVLFASACGKQLNPDFCDAHPADDRCLESSGADSTTDTAISGDAVSGCPSNYDVTLTGSTSKYRVVDTVISWIDATSDCEDDKTTGPYTHLIVLSSSTERQALMPYANLERSVGHTDNVTEGTWIPITTEPGSSYPGIGALSMPPWLSGEPNGGGNCAVVDTGVELRDRDCGSEVAAYVCECDAFPVDPTHF